MLLQFVAIYEPLQTHVEERRERLGSWNQARSREEKNGLPLRVEIDLCRPIDRSIMWLMLLENLLFLLRYDSTQATARRRCPSIMRPVGSASQ